MPTRPSPSEHANDHKNKVMKGNDDNNWISKMDKNGVYKWKKLKKGSQCKTAEEFYMQNPDQKIKYDIKDIVKKLVKIEKKVIEKNILFSHIKWNVEFNYPASDETDTFLINKFMPIIKKHYKDDECIMESLLMKKRSNKCKKVFISAFNIIEPFSVVTYQDYNLFRGSLNGKIELFHKFVNKEDKDYVYSLLEDAFGKLFVKPKQNKLTASFIIKKN